MRRVPRFEAGLLFKELLDSREEYERKPEDLPEGSNEEENYLVRSMVHSDGHGADVLSKLSRYEARLSNRYFKALNHLQEAQDRHRAATSKAGKSEPATAIRKPRIQRIPRRSEGELTPKTKQ